MAWMQKNRLLLAGLVVLWCMGAVACGDSEMSLEAAGDFAAPEGPSMDDSVEGPSVAPGQLTAGEWRDLDHWSFFRGLLDPQTGSFGQMERYWGFDVSQRFAVLILDEEGAPVGDAAVELLDGSEASIWAARTDSEGRADLFSGVFENAEGPYTIVAASGEARDVMPEALPSTGEQLVLTLSGAARAEPVADIMFMIDTTGSMGDELSYLQSELRNVVERVDSETASTTRLRLSTNFYRDEGDAYLVRDNAFTEDLGQVVAQLQKEGAAGGGDYPEAVEAALVNAIRAHEWSDSARARLLFLLLDAPPHRTAQTLASMHDVTREAAKRGIRIIPIGASGVDRDTEFLMRFLDVATGGTYVFLTDDSGIGDPHLAPSVGDVQVEPLNDLLVRLIVEALG